jgi:hypothetical protein
MRVNGQTGARPARLDNNIVAGAAAGEGGAEGGGGDRNVTIDHGNLRKKMRVRALDSPIIAGGYVRVTRL